MVEKWVVANEQAQRHQENPAWKIKCSPERIKKVKYPHHRGDIFLLLRFLGRSITNIKGKIMKVKFLHWYNALAATLLSLLGFSSCGSEFGKDEPCLYGSPTSSFHAKGNVADEDGTPIKGIKAVVVEDYGNAGSYRMDSAYTDSKGDYVTKEKSMDGAIDWVHKEKRLKVILEDVDGGANGGEFATDTIKSENITVEQVGKGEGTWDWGSFEVTANGKMKKKK